MSRKNESLKYRVIIDPALTSAFENPNKEFLEFFCNRFFGKTADGLAKEIHNGRYDEVLKNEVEE